MATASTLIGVGISPGQAEFLGYSNLTPIAAAGTSQTTATAIKGYVTQVEVISATSPTALGIRLPADVEFQIPYFVLNSSAVAINIYPPSGSKIDAGSTNAAVSLAAGYSQIFNRIDNTRWTSTVNASGAGFARYVATRTAMAALSGATDPVVFLEEAGRQGAFVWNGSNLSANVTADPQQGIYVAPASDTTGASGAWVRVYVNDLTAEMFGAVGDGTTDDLAALTGLINYLKTIFTTGFLAPYWLFALGGIFVLVTVFMPKGVLGFLSSLKFTRSSDEELDPSLEAQSPSQTAK